jgi:hypothetical protein
MLKAEGQTLGGASCAAAQPQQTPHLPQHVIAAVKREGRDQTLDIFLVIEGYDGTCGQMPRDGVGLARCVTPMLDTHLRVDPTRVAVKTSRT